MGNILLFILGSISLVIPSSQSGGETLLAKCTQHRFVNTRGWQWIEIGNSLYWNWVFSTKKEKYYSTEIWKSVYWKVFAIRQNIKSISFALKYESPYIEMSFLCQHGKVFVIPRNMSPKYQLYNTFQFTSKHKIFLPHGQQRTYHRSSSK